jgi:DNA repair exonuclease SbcCD ATPase subunit
MSKREGEKAIEATKKIAEEAKRVEDKRDAAQTLQKIEGHVTAQEFQQDVKRSLDETKDNVKKSIDEARTQIPKYTDVVKNYQEQALQSTREMVVDYIDAQKSIIDSVFNFAVWEPYYENLYKMYSYWFSPRIPVEIYVRTVSNIADSISAAAKMNNDIIFGNINAIGNAFERAQQHTKELAKINVNNAKTIANTARETAGFSVSTSRRGEGYIS